MRVVHLAWLLVFIATAEAQKAAKATKHARQAEVSSQYAKAAQAGPGYQNQYAYAPQSSHGQGHGHAQGGHGGGAHAAYSGGLSGAGAGTAKATYPLLLSDSRTLNQDGTINFQYAADNGLQQGETVDPDGTRRGFYSYPGADGKPITVKYTAGKNGFVAEGDHLPRQPQAAAHSDKDEEIAGKTSYPAHGGHSGAHHGGQAHGGGHGGHAGAHYGHAAGPAYSGQGRPQAYSGGDDYPRPKPYAGGGHSGAYQGGSHYTGRQAPQYSHQPAPAPHYSSGHGGQGHHGGGGAGFAGFGAGGPQGFKDFGPVNYGAPSHAAHAHAAPQTHYATHALPSGGKSHGSGFRGPVHSAINPYQQSGAAGPYAENFDLGNGGQFSIDFNPGKSQEVPIGGDYGGHLQSQSRARPYYL